MEMIARADPQGTFAIAAGAPLLQEPVRPNAVLVYAPHPLLASAGREIITEPFFPGETIADYLGRIGLNLNHQAVVLQLDGATIAREHWHRVRPKAGRMITIRGVVQDGGGDNKALNTLLTIAVIVVAIYAPVAWLGLAQGSFGAVLATAGIQVAGMMLVNAIAPLRPPAPPDAAAEASPTYALSGGGNRARLYQPLPLVVGTHRMFPDLGAKEYTEFLGEDQYLYQVFNFGLSDVTLSAIKVGETLLADYAGVETQESDSSGALTLFPANVDSLAGGQLIKAGAWVTRTSSVNTTGLAVDLSAVLFGIDTKTGNLRPTYALLELQYRVVGAGVWSIFSAQNIAQPPPGWEAAQYTVVYNVERKPLRLGYRISVAAGQYEVRARLVDAVSGDWTYDSALDETTNMPIGWLWGTYPLTPEATVNWDQLRSYQPDTATYTGQKRYALKIKATGQLNGRVDSFNAIASARTLAWTSSAWVLQATSNPAWWFLWAARGKQIGTRRAFGAGLADARIDIEAIKAWGTFCDAKSLTCNAVFDRAISMAEMLLLIARCGRGIPTWASGKLGVVWDAANQPAVAVFGMSNIKRGSFQVDYLTGNLADEIEISFINPALNWQPDVVRKAVPGAGSSGERPARIEFFGCTDVDMAGREANLLAAAQQKRRRRVTWEADFEGLVCNRGDVVTLSHDLTQWGYSGRLVAGTTLQLTLDRAVPFTVGQLHYVGVRAPDGTYAIYDVVTVVGSQTVIDLNPLTPLPAAPNADVSHPPYDYLWFFEPKPTPGKKVKITGVQPLDANTVRLSAIDEDPDYYLAEIEAYTYVPPSTFGVRLPTITKLEVNDTLVATGGGYAVVIKAVWDVTGEYGGAFVRAARVGETLKDLGTVLGRRFDFQAPASGQWVIEVTAFNLLGKYGSLSRVTQTYTILGKDRPPQNVTGFVVTQNGSSVVARWNKVGDIDIEGYYLRYGPRGASSWENATPWSDADSGTTMTSLAVPPGDFDFFIKARDQSQPKPNYSVTAAVASLNVTTQFNAIFQARQAPDWPGTRTNLVKHWTGVLVPESQDLAGLTNDQALFSSFVINPFATCTYEAAEFDLGFDGDIRVWGDIISALGPGESVGVADPKLEIDYRTAAGAYGGWRAWGIGNVFARYVKFRFVMQPALGKAKVTGFLPTADAIEFTQRGQNLTVAIGGTAVVFAKPYHLVPSIRVWVSNGSANIATFTSGTTTGFTAKVFSGAAADVGGVVNWEAVGV